MIALVLVVVLFALPALLNAQTPPQAPSARSSDDTPKVELFVGYQWLNPGGSVPVPGSPTTTTNMPSLTKGFGTSLSYNFNRFFSIEGNYGGNSDSNTNSINTVTGGPKLTYRGDGVNFFVHGLVGFGRIKTDALSPVNGFTAILGGGMDLKLWRPISLRVFEADFQYSQVTFPGNLNENFDGALLRTGLVFNMGGAPPEVPVAASCSVQPTEVMVGEPVHATVTASNFNPKHTVTYAWSSNGGKIEGKDTGATIDTNGVSGGNYTVTATVTDPKAKKNNMASCTANFTVKEPPKNPPQMSCSANPTTLQTGGTSTISCSCTSPDNVPVTVGGWTSTGGSISGNGNSATLNTTGAAAGPITISATCTDSRGLTASSSSTVTVEVPPPPPPLATKLNECDYSRSVKIKKPWRVDNDCKQALEDPAHALQRDPDAKLVVVGNAGPDEKRKNLAAERAVDVKAFLVSGEAQFNIDPSRIECRTGNAGTPTTEQWIVPAGATFPNASSTTPVDESQVKPIPDHPKPAAKKAAKKAQ